jgi:hypothetical protein
MPTQLHKAPACQRLRPDPFAAKCAGFAGIHKRSFKSLSVIVEF